MARPGIVSVRLRSRQAPGCNDRTVVPAPQIDSNIREGHCFPDTPANPPGSAMTSWTISIHLLGKSVRKYSDALKEKTLVERVNPKKGRLRDAELYVKQTRQKPPMWEKLLAEGFDLSRLRLKGGSASAVLFLTAEKRKFALTFGYGHALLDDAKLVPDFGLKAALNMLDPTELRSIDTLRPEFTGLRKRHQVGRLSRIGEFDLDPISDVFRSASGRSKNPEAAKTVTGAAALRIAADLNCSTLPAKCAHALKLYYSDSYKKSFGMYDNLQQVQDSATIEKLDKKLLSAIRKRNLSRLNLAPPEIIDLKEIQGYKYKKRMEPKIKLDISDYLDAQPTASPPDLNKIKRDSVYVQIEGDENERLAWRLYKCIIFECTVNNHHYVLNEGTWHCIGQEFHSRITQFFKDKTVEMKLPTAGAKEKECEYCKRVSKEKGFFLFDRAGFSVPGETDQYELCDLLIKSTTPADRILLHLKSGKGGSGTLSHLFRQGLMAGRLFCIEPAFRCEAREHLTTKLRGDGRLIPKQRPDTSKYTVRFGIITTRKVRTGDLDIPFFSKVTFQSSAVLLEALGYKTDVCLIERESQ